MDDWYRHSASDGGLDGACGLWSVAQSSDPDASYRSEWPVSGDERIAAPVVDDKIGRPVWMIAGTVAVTGGSVSDRGDAVALVRQRLDANLDRFRVLSEHVEASATTLSFHAATATQHEDWTLEAISAACQSASSLNGTATEPSVTARVVSLRTRRQLAG